MGGGKKYLLTFLIVIVITYSFIFESNMKAYANHPDNRVVSEGKHDLYHPDMGVWGEANYKIVLTPNHVSISDIHVKLKGSMTFDKERDQYLYIIENGSFYKHEKILRTEHDNEIIFPGIELPNVYPMSSYHIILGLKVFSGKVRMYPSGDIIHYTPPANPVIELRDTGQSYISLKLNLKGNGGGFLQRYSENTGTYINIYIYNLTGYVDGSTFTDNGLSPNTTYRYRTVHTFQGITSYNWQGGNFYVEFTTSSDPAVVAAQKAENAAQLARVAAENSVQHTLNAESAALSAENKASEAVELIKKLKNELMENSNEINISYVKIANNATAIKNEYLELYVGAKNADQYRAKISGEYTDWQDNPNMIIPISGTKGIVGVEVEARNSKDILKIDKYYLNIFKL